MLKSYMVIAKKKDIIKLNIPKAWRKLHIEGDEFFIELLAEKTENICGHRPDNKEVSEFLLSIVNPDQSQINERNIKPQKEEFTTTKRHINEQTQKGELVTLNYNFVKKYIVYFVFLNENIPVNKWKDLLIKFLEIIHIKHPNDFYKLTSIRGTKRIYFTKNQNELNLPCKIPNTEYFVETKFSANSIVSIIKDVLSTYSYNENDLLIKINN